MRKIILCIMGGLIAVISLILVKFGNPANMGICVACFLRDIAGSLGFHSTSIVQYFRPEIIGILLGVFILSLFRKEFLPKGGSAPFTRFILGFSLMIGALIFLGCPLRMVLRISGGDLNGLVGLGGFIVGILTGVFFLKKGYSLNKTSEVTKTDVYLPHIIFLVFFVLLLLGSSVLAFSTMGPGSMHAPPYISLIAGLILGGIGFYTRLCFVGSLRDAMLFKEFSMFGAFGAILVVGIVGNLILGSFKLGFLGQPIAHSEWLWNFLGMTLVGLCSVLLGGCPFRQLILAGSGNSDSFITVLGMLAGGAFAHNFGMASSATGVTQNGKIGFSIALVIVLFIAIYNIKLRVKS